MEFKGTKGKWYVSGDKYPTIQSKNMNPLIVVTYPTIATVTSTFIDYEEYSANAKLISCAPEMLQMLKDILDNNRQYWGEEENSAYQIDEIEQLIKKATKI